MVFIKLSSILFPFSEHYHVYSLVQTDRQTAPKACDPTVLQALASFLVLHAVIVTFSFGVKNLKKKILIVDSDGSKEAF